MRWHFLALAPVALVSAPSALDKPKPLDISNYKKWHLVNETPVKMSEVVSMMCRAPLPAALQNSRDTKSPHREYFARVYVSDNGKEFRQVSKPIRVGTVIVKEKLEGREDKHPELFTIMRKRENGFDREHGDWEYAVADERRKIIEQGKIARCISCHETQKSTDYLYRSYFTFN